MADQFGQFIAVLKAFDEFEVDYVLIGGVAVVLQGMERLTRDIDIMSRQGVVATYDDLEFEIIAFQGTNIKLATPETLYRLKKDTIRDKDKIDAEFLKELIRARKTNSLSKH